MWSFRAAVFLSVASLLIGCNRPAVEHNAPTAPAAATPAPGKTPPPAAKGSGPAVQKFGSPAAVFTAFKKAVAKNDAGALVDCVSDRSVKILVAYSIASGLDVYDLKDAAKTGKVNDLFDAHGLVAHKAKTTKDIDGEKVHELADADLDAVAAPVKKPRDFVAAMAKVTGKRYPIPAHYAAGEVKNVVMAGARAEGEMSAKGMPTTPIFFEAQPDGWRVVLPTAAKLN